MERALDPELLALALGQQAALPSVDEISALIGNAELALLLGNPQVDIQLVNTGWYLHAVAASKYSLRTYGLARQRAAFRVAGHIFDLITKTRDLSNLDKLKYGFGSQIAYLRSELNPNAIAIYQQDFLPILSEPTLLDNFQEVALSSGIGFLGFDVNYVFRLTRKIRDEANSLITNWNISDIFATPFGSAAGVALATRAMMNFLVDGRNGDLDRAKGFLENAIASESPLC